MAERNERVFQLNGAVPLRRGVGGSDPIEPSTPVLDLPALTACSPRLQFDYLRDWRSLAMWVDHFRLFADAIHTRGSPLRNVFAFIDGKLQEVARPGRYQGTHI